MDTVGFGIVGAGRIFEQHAVACNSLGGRARLVALADIDEAQLQKAASKYSIPFTAGDYRTLLIETILMSSPYVHRQFCMSA